MSVDLRGDNGSWVEVFRDGKSLGFVDRNAPEFKARSIVDIADELERLGEKDE
jgi:hypothetical protein